APRVATGVRRRAHPGGPVGASIHPGRSDALVLRARRWGTRTELGKYVGGPSTVRCIVVVLVDVSARRSSARGFSALLPRSRCVARAARRSARMSGEAATAAFED